MNKKIFILIAVLVATPLIAFAQEKGFVPLTNIQNVKFAGNATDLPAFLNSVYMICIGLAAVIGVLQIMRAGVTWMTAAGSHEKIGDAKNLIRDTIIGLVLVLAPTIVFSIINPDILKLQIRGLDGLGFAERVQQNAETAKDILWVDSESGFMQSNARCSQEGGLPVPHCKPTDGSQSYPMVENGDCKGSLYTVCMKRESTPAASCKDFKKVTIKPAGSACDGSKGEARAENSCCSGITTGGICCGMKTLPISPENPPPSRIQATGEVNQACKPLPNKTEIAFNDYPGMMCCNYQDGGGVSCEAVATPDRQKQYCSCKYDTSTK